MRGKKIRIFCSISDANAHSLVIGIKNSKGINGDLLGFMYLLCNKRGIIGWFSLKFEKLVDLAGSLFLDVFASRG